MTQRDASDMPAPPDMCERFAVRFERVESGLIHVQVSTEAGAMVLLGYFHPTAYAGAIGEAITRCISWG